MVVERKQMSANHPSELLEVDAATVGGWLDTGQAILVDVREASEYEFENVPGSFLLPLSFLDANRFPAITDKKVVFLCAMGKRGATAQRIIAGTGLPHIYNLIGGLEGWKKAGLETQGGRFEALDYAI
jgi:rhodanese-related sulfurtransferase